MDAHVALLLGYNADDSVSKPPVEIVIHDMLFSNDDTRRIWQRLSSGPITFIAVVPDLYQGLGPNQFV